MTHKPRAMTADEAEAVALDALAFLASDADQLGRFLTLSGIDLSTLRAEAGTPGVQAAILDYVMRDESLLLTLAANRGRDPLEIASAHRALSGTEPW